MTNGRLSTFAASLVIARRDFLAILLSRSFLFFLLGPLFTMMIGGLAGAAPPMRAMRVTSSASWASSASSRTSLTPTAGPVATSVTGPLPRRAAANAAKLGQTFADANRTAKAGVAMREVAKTVMGVGEGEVLDEPGKAKTSLLGKLDLKSMLSKKPKAAPAKAPAAAQA